MHLPGYNDRRNKLTTYFDKTASTAWQTLTSNSPVSRIRATVRAGRDEMRATLLAWLPEDLSGRTLVDAGCGTGALAIEAAKRGAEVFAIDVAGSLIEAARERTPADLGEGSIEFVVGDMLNDLPDKVDYVVAMDSLIHYDEADVLAVIERFARCARHKILFTSAPWTPALGLMHFVGGYLPNKKDRAPAIQPHKVDSLCRRIDGRLATAGWSTARSYRVSTGFYKSQAIEVTM